MNDTLRKLWKLAESVDSIWVTPEHFALLPEQARKGSSMVNLRVRRMNEIVVVPVRQIAVLAPEPK